MTRPRSVRSALLLGLFAAASGFGAAVEPEDARALLVAAERQLTLVHPGADPGAAMELLRQAAALGDPVATLRAALLPAAAGKYPWVSVPTPELVAAVVRLAEEGDPIAQGVLGTHYLVGADSDPQRAARLYESSLGAYPWSAHNLGWMYSVGEGVTTDLEIARDLWRASVTDNPSSEYTLALLYLQGNGVDQDVPQGLALLRSAAARDHVPSIGELGRILSFGQYGVAPDLAEGRSRLEAAARRGFPWAELNLGSLFFEGGESVRDLPAAQAWFRRCAPRLAECANYLGYMLAHGQGSEPDVDGALHWLAEATLGGDLYAFGNITDLESTAELTAEQTQRALATFEQAAASGSAGAQGALAIIHCDGRFGVSTDRERCLRLARRGAEGGSAHAMRALGTVYRYGFGIEKNESEAIAWWTRAAEAGDRLAAYRLGDAYLRGNGVASDREAGLEWLERAASQGWHDASVRLAEIYEYGWFSIEPDLTKARDWYTQAAASGHALAKGWLAAAAELDEG